MYWRQLIECEGDEKRTALVKEFKRRQNVYRIFAEAFYRAEKDELKEYYFNNMYEKKKWAMAIIQKIREYDEEVRLMDSECKIMMMGTCVE